LWTMSVIDSMVPFLGECVSWAVLLGVIVVGEGHWQRTS
jgi:hypothetical protein